VGSVVWRASPGCELAEYTEPERKLWRGDPALVYRSGQLSVVVLPQRGGKIASIRYRDREWLTQPQRALLPLADLPPLLVEGDMFGWDECAPTIDDCEVMGHQLPLHGDVWNQPWTEGESGWLEVTGRHLRFRLQRRLSIHAGGFRLDYAVSAPERIPFLWAAHPQFAASPDVEVVFGDGSPPLVDLFGRGYWQDLPSGGPVHLKDIPAGRSAKLFVDPTASSGRAQLIHPDGAAIAFQWDAACVPYLGVWLDRAAIGPVDAVAIEPMTGYADSCATAMQAGRVLWLTSGQPVRWTLAVTLGQRKHGAGDA